MLTLAKTAATLAVLSAASGCAGHRTGSAATAGSGQLLVPDGWTSVTVAVVPDVWHVAGEPSNSMADGVSPGPYTYRPVPAQQATRIAAEINAGPVDRLLPRSCPIGLASAHLVFHYPGRTIPVLVDPNCGDASREDVDDNRIPMRTLSAALRQDLLTVAPGFAVSDT